MRNFVLIGLLGLQLSACGTIYIGDNRGASAAQQLPNYEQMLSLPDGASLHTVKKQQAVLPPSTRGLVLKDVPNQPRRLSSAYAGE